ncbi:hypothetical protein V6Z11_D12G049700 [Gossypium hirsutum]
MFRNQFHSLNHKEPMINTYARFRDDVLPRIKRLGYNAIQIMAIQEHSYYASFEYYLHRNISSNLFVSVYHVKNFFAPSSRFGTPDDLKSLIDKAHEWVVAAYGVQILVQMQDGGWRSISLMGTNLMV